MYKLIIDSQGTDDTPHWFVESAKIVFATLLLSAIVVGFLIGFYLLGNLIYSL